jgi:PTS system glucitol/sorbitol-specific IIA component
MYRSKVIEVGELVSQFADQQLVVLFGASAPDELKEISVIHELEESDSAEPLQPGGTISFGAESFRIDEVGPMANANLREMGHLSIYFRSTPGDLLPGAIRVSPVGFPDIEAGDSIVIE